MSRASGIVAAMLLGLVFPIPNAGAVNEPILLADIIPGSDGSLSWGFTDVNGTVFFAAGEDVLNQELWKSDGTPGGTVLVKDIRQTGYADSNPSSFTDLGGTVFFSARGNYTGRELWKSDG